MRDYILGVAILGIAFQAQCCSAGITTLGPIPYLSKGDSPFPVNGTDPNFYLEDFEDGLLNTTGLSLGQLPLDPASRAVVFPPGIFTDSVDADDGVIDGNGQGGHSLASGLTIEAGPAGLESYSFYMSFQFNQSELGFLPNTFGFVWTDGPAPGGVSMSITTGSGAVYQTPIWGNLGDDSREGTTADDVFFGVIADEGILQVLITGGFGGEELSSGKYMEIDHVQYGQLVPEPTAFGQILLCMGLIAAAKRRRFVRYRSEAS